jgi:hypothetical protein
MRGEDDFEMIVEKNLIQPNIKVRNLSNPKPCHPNQLNLYIIYKANVDTVNICIYIFKIHAIA